MSQMLLSGPERALIYTGLIDESGEDPVNLRSIKSWLPAISSRIEQYLNRRLHIEEYTEYWDSTDGQKEYFLAYGAPIRHINSVMASSMGLYTGEEYLVTDYFPSRFGHALSLSYPVTPWRKGLRATYTGGYAYHGTQSTYAVTSVSGTWAAGKYVSSSSGAMGLVVSVSGTDNYAVIDNLYGVFQVGDLLREQDSEFSTGAATGLATITVSSEKNSNEINFAVNNVSGTWTVGKYVKGITSGCVGQIVAVGTTYITCTWYYFGSSSNFFVAGESIQEQDDFQNVGQSDGTATITAFVQRALCEAYPEITTACEIELRYMLKHQYDLENQGTYKEQTSRRPDKWVYQLQPEAIALLSPHCRYVF